MKKFELTSETKIVDGVVLHRIKALTSFGIVKAGQLGGFVEKEENLSQGDFAWVYDNACVYGDAYVCNNAQIFGNAHVYDKAIVCDNAIVTYDALVRGAAVIGDNARVLDTSIVDGWGKVYGFAVVSDNAQVYEKASVRGNAQLFDNAHVYGKADVFGNALIADSARICGIAIIDGDELMRGNAYIKHKSDYSVVKGFGTLNRTTTFFRCEDGSVKVSCGCFYGTIQEFRDRVIKTRTKKIAEEYLMIADLMEKHFS